MKIVRKLYPRGMVITYSAEEEEKEEKVNMDIIKIMLAIFLILFIIISPCIYFCSHCERFPYYAEEDYYFAAVQIGSGRDIEEYFGVITKEDYERWCNGEKGIVTVYNARKNGRCWRVNSMQVTAITNYGNEPEWLPLNF